MRPLRRIPGLLRRFRLPHRPAHTLDADVDDELRFHLDMRAAELARRRGLDPAAARAEALRQFGDLEDARRYMRREDDRIETAIRRREHMDDLRQDLTHALRGLRRNRAFAATVVLALAFGIGASTAIFTAIDAVLLRPLPVERPERLVAFGDPTLVGVNNSGSPSMELFSWELYRALRDRAGTVSGLLASGYSGRFDVAVADPGAAAGPAEPERVRGRLVSGNYFAVLGARAEAGRTLLPDDDRAPGAGPVAVISDAYWRRRFGRDPGVVGRTIRVNRVPVTVVGVAAPGFAGEIVGRRFDLWLPITMQPLLLTNQDWLHDRSMNWLLLMGRLRPDASAAQAGAELTALARAEIVAAGAAAPPATARVAASPGRRGLDGVPREFRVVFAIALGLTLVVLVVVCANVANLLLARSLARRPEIGIRLALGAGRRRVVRQLLAECVLLGAAGGALALLVVQAGSVLLLRGLGTNGEGIPLDVSLDWRVLGYAAGLSLVTAVLLGLAPALLGTRLDLARTLQTGGRGVPTGGAWAARRGLGVGRWLVVAQVAFSLVLLAGAGLLVRTARHLEGRDPGLARDELLVVSVDAYAAGYRGARLLALQERLVEQLGRLPGVRGAVVSQAGLFSGIEIGATLQVEGFAARAPDDTTANTDQVGPGYFRTIGARIVRGRDIEPRDREGAERVAVVNETMARFYFPGRDPIGRTFTIDTTRFTIVGVAADVTSRSLTAPPARQLYTALEQNGSPPLFVVTLRTTGGGDPARLAAAARREVLAVDAGLGVRSVEPLASLMRDSLGPQRAAAYLAGVAGALALALTALGLYGVITYATVRRTGEFGLRMALGARPRDVTRLVLREALGLVAVGAAVGLPAALGVARLLRSQLVGVGVVDPPTLGAALAVVAVVAAAAGYLPASRAARVAPQSALLER